MYYLRTRAAIDPIQFTVDPSLTKQHNVHMDTEPCTNCSA